ncbi:MAG: hypothetical protein QM597_07690 [Aeromicrobium sp.]|uniref:hypothetical protein n=1 Tax=Aeromicrobium sp. TaxID=1871063 RepID=UPI0039E4F6A3
MRTLTSAALQGGFLTLTVIAALRACDPVLSVAVVSAVTVTLAWFAALSRDDTASGLDVTGTLPGVALALVGRASWGNLLPTLAMQAVIAVALGAGAKALDDRLGPTLLIATGAPTLALAGIAGGLAGIATAWVNLAIDGDGPIALAAVPPLLAGATGPLALLAIFHPAAALGLSTAGVLPWDVTAVGLSAALLGTVLGTYAIGALLPSENE